MRKRIPLYWFACSVLPLFAACETGLPKVASTAQALTCDPRLDAFPVRARHNVGYDRTAGDSTQWTCDDDHSNSDFIAARHLGNDIWAQEGAPVVATVDGELRYVENNDYSGNKLTIVDSCGWYHFYAHMQAFAPGMADGVHVKAGQVVGYVGKTGSAAHGTVHLHYSIYPADDYQRGVDPWPYLHAVEHDVCAPLAHTANHDVNGDGRGDLVVSSSRFMANARVAVTDANGDGKADIVLARANGDATEIHLIRGTSWSRDRTASRPTCTSTDGLFSFPPFRRP